MASMQLKGFYLLHWPGILAELDRNQINMDDLYYVDVETRDQFTPETAFTPDIERQGKVKKEIIAKAVLHSGKQIPLRLTELIYTGLPRPEEPPHSITTTIEHEGRKYHGTLYLVEEDSMQGEGEAEIEEYHGRDTYPRHHE